MRDGIWYREEFDVLEELVINAIRHTSMRDTVALTSLGHLLLKIRASAATAPSAHTPESAT